MTATKNQMLIDHDDQYIPVVRTFWGETRMSAKFNIADQSSRSEKRLKQLVDFIRNNSCDLVGVTHRLAEQIVHLAYWENFALEFWLEENGGATAVLLRFPKQPEMIVVLDVFKDGADPYSEIEEWWDFICRTISAYAEIWQIALVVDKSVYDKVIHGVYPKVHVDIVLDKLKSILDNGVSVDTQGDNNG